MDKGLDFSIFEGIAKHPGEQLRKYREEGRKVIGCFPLFIPEVLVYASGMMPFGMWGAETEVSDAKRYFPAYICGIMQTNLEIAMKGGYKGISGVLMPTMCDSLKCSTQNWKYAVPSIEMIPINYPQNRKSKGAFSFLYRQYESIQGALERISGRKIRKEDMEQAISIYNEHNCIMRQFAELCAMHPAEISPKNRSFVFKSSYFMDKREHTGLVKGLISKIRQMSPERFNGIRVVTTGIIADSCNLLEIFEGNKISIAIDDVAHESRQYRVDIQHGEDAIAALVEQYLDLYSCTTLIGGKIAREDYIFELVKRYKADGVIALMTKFCDPDEYDFPLIKKKMEKEGIPILTIEVDKQIVNYGQASTAVQSFQEMIRL